jgi:hypothetical protein
MQVHDEFLAGFGNHQIRMRLHSLLAPEKILHTDAMYPLII